MHATHSPSEPAGRPLPTRTPRGATRRWTSLAIVCLAVLVIVMDGSIVNVALPTLAVTIEGATNSRLQWVVDAYILAFAALLLTAGSTADRFGRRRVLRLGLLTFAATSVGAAFAQGTGSLILWRALMGIGAALIFPSTLAIITEDFPEPSLRRTAIAIWAGSSGLGVAIGPVAGGWLHEHFHWGSIFLVNLPVVAVALIGTALAVPESRDPLRVRFDPIGCGLAIGGVLALVYGLIEAPERGWTSMATIVPLSLAVALLTGFVAWERVAAAPIIDLAHVRDPRFSAGCLAIAAAFFGLFGFVFMITQYFQFLRGYDALGAGLRTAPFAAFILLGAIVAAAIERRAGSRSVVAGGLLLMAVGFAWATGDGASTPYRVMVAQMAVLGVGLGLINAAATESIMSSLPVHLAGTGSSVNDTLREVGGTLGVAGMGSAFNALYRGSVTDALLHAPLPADAKELARSSIGAATIVIARVHDVAGPEAARLLRAPIETAFLRGFSASCWIASAAAALGAVGVLLLMPRRPSAASEPVHGGGPAKFSGAPTSGPG